MVIFWLVGQCYEIFWCSGVVKLVIYENGFCYCKFVMKRQEDLDVKEVFFYKFWKGKECVNFLYRVKIYFLLQIMSCVIYILFNLNYIFIKKKCYNFFVMLYFYV